MDVNELNDDLAVLDVHVAVVVVGRNFHDVDEDDDVAVVVGGAEEEEGDTQN